MLTLEEIRIQNRARAARWHADGEPWTASDWSNALAGEVGELCNFVKKVRRHETKVDRVEGGSGSYNTPSMEELLPRIAAECADVLLYLDLVADHFGIDLEESTRVKFNAVSKAQGFPERL